MSTSTDKTVTVRMDPTAINKQVDVIGPATPGNAGVMTAEQAAKLAGLTPGGNISLQAAFDGGPRINQDGTSISLNQVGDTPYIQFGDDDENPIADVSNVAAGLRIHGQDADEGSGDAGKSILLDPGVGDGAGADGQVEIAGAIIENTRAFGSPVVKSKTVGGFMSYTSDGVGPLYGGTGVTPQQNLGTPSASLVALTLNDRPWLQLSGEVPGVSAQLEPMTEGGNNALDFGGPFPLGGLRRLWYQIASAQAGPPLTISGNAIAPAYAIHSVGAGLIKNITPPFAGFTGSIVLRPTAAFTYDNTGNVLVAAGGGTATVNRDMVATFDGAKWAMSY